MTRICQNKRLQWIHGLGKTDYVKHINLSCSRSLTQPLLLQGRGKCLNTNCICSYIWHMTWICLNVTMMEREYVTKLAKFGWITMPSVSWGTQIWTELCLKPLTIFKDHSALPIFYHFLTFGPIFHNLLCSL